MMRKIIILGICMALVLPAVTAAVNLNEPPAIPSIDGPPKGKAGVEYEYQFCSTDPDGDDISYCIDWGDGSGEFCIGPFPSGTCVTQKHIWTTEGSYTIRCKAQDINQLESDYATLNIQMPYAYSQPTLFQSILQLIYLRIQNLRILFN